MRLYIHVPFCRKRCYYCSFATVVGQEHQEHLFIDCLCEEIRQHPRCQLSSVYVGGGTPSMLGEESVLRLFACLRGRFIFKADIEITIEANPEDISDTKLRAFKAVGVNRMSLGLQSFNDQVLKFLGRTHTSGDNKRAFQALRSADFDNISVDLIYNWPRQNAKLLTQDLTVLQPLEPDHISLYMLTIEAPSRLAACGCRPLSADRQRRNFFLAHQFLEDAGYAQYEVSNYARPGKQSQHNRGYWSGEPYFGIGPGAHSFVDCQRYWNDPLLMSYMKKITRKENPRIGAETLSNMCLFMDRLLFGLRLTQGVSVSHLEGTYQVKLSQRQRDHIERYVRAGFFIRDGEVLRTTLSGQMVLDEISVNLIDL